jgi:type II secretory pathway pseudopilin PulG
MTPEPRPDEPTPQAPLPKRPVSNRAILGALLFVIMSIVALLLMPPIMGNRNVADLTEASSHLRSLSLNLYAFDEEYGSFPDASTAVDVKESTGTPLTLGDSSSNQLFRQLLATLGRDEIIFWARTSRDGKKPDNIIDSDATALAPGECSFSYVAGRSSADTGAPVVMAPLIPGTTRFDPKPFGGKALVLFIGTSSTPLPIEPDGRVLVNGRDLFDPAQPYWRGTPPDLKWPE